jgi:hypothetical protein
MNRIYYLALFEFNNRESIEQMIKDSSSNHSSSSSSLTPNNISLNLAATGGSPSAFGAPSDYANSLAAFGNHDLAIAFFFMNHFVDFIFFHF